MTHLHFNFRRSVRTRGFSLVELLVVVAMISVLAALLLPALATTQGRARTVVCSSNLRQIGGAMSLYMQDYDGYYPYAVDPVDVFTVPYWAAYPGFQTAIPSLPQLHDVLHTYTQSRGLFRCAGDSGFIMPDFRPVTMNAFPSSFQKYKTSYGYRTELAARKINESDVKKPAELNLLMDLSGHWHGTLVPLEQRYNVLFGDGHMKNVTRAQMDGLWGEQVF